MSKTHKAGWCRNLLFTILVVLAPIACRAQSSSNWVRISSGDPNIGSINPELGNSYLTVHFVTARIYQKSNWWTNLVETNRKAILDVTLTGKVKNVEFAETRTSPPIELVRNDKQNDIGWSSIVIQRFPTTYSNLQLRIRISKSSEDGLDSLLGVLTELSNKTPGLQVSQAAIGGTSAVKFLADHLFQKNLLQKKLTSTIEFPNSGDSLPAGTYVSFAADSVDEYEKYLNVSSLGQGLTWTGSQLLWGGKEIPGLSYFVVKVAYDQRVFDKPVSALSFPKPWALLYQVARRKVGEIYNIDDEKRIAGEMRAHLSNARTLLDDDLDYTQEERENIHATLLEDTQNLLDKRHSLMASKKNKPGGGVLLKVPEDIKATTILKEMRGIEKHGIPASPAHPISK